MKEVKAIRFSQAVKVMDVTDHYWNIEAPKTRGLRLTWDGAECTIYYKNAVIGVPLGNIIQYEPIVTTEVKKKAG